MLTNHEKIRLEAGYQHRFSRIPFLNTPNGSGQVFYVNTDDPVKIVPNFYTGNTLAGVSDVSVWVGLSGVNGASQMTVSSIDVNTGAVTLSSVPSNGSSLTIDYASSPLTYNDIETARLRAESTVNQRLSLCYNLPISPVPSMIENMASRLAASFLLIKDYGIGSRSTSKDGYMLYEQLMGKNQDAYSATGIGVIEVGEIGMICRPGYQLVDDSGAVISRNDEGTVNNTISYVAGGRVAGRLNNITDENMRFKQPQIDADTRQSGSGYDGTIPQQG